MWGKRGPLAVIVAAVAMAAIALTWSARSSQSARQDDVFRVGVLPSAAEADLQERYAPLFAQISRETGFKFQLVTANSYDDLIDRFKAHRLDLVFFGGFTFIQARAFAGAEPLVRREANERATAYAVVKTGSPFQDCTNLKCPGLKQARLLFGPKLSTSGHLMPRYFLKTAYGLDPEKDFREVRYSSGHRATVLDIRDGGADVGMVFASTFQQMLLKGELKPGELTILWETPPFPDAVWAIPRDMDEATKTKLRDAFLALDMGDDARARALGAPSAGSYLPAGPADYDSLTRIAESLGLMTSELP